MKKSLYGLKKASRQWNTKFSNVMIEGGLCRSQHDHLLFFKHDTSITLLVVYVDDIVITGSCVEAIDNLKLFFHSKLQLKDFGPHKYFLGIEVARSKEGIYLNQRKYALDLIADTWVTCAKPFDMPMEQNKKFTSHELDSIMQQGHNNASADPSLADPSEYQRLVGRLIYLTITRLDICFAVQSLSQFMHAPETSHLDAAIRVVKYIKGNPGQGIILQTSAYLYLTAYRDSDWAACPMSRRYVTGYCIKIGNFFISWKSKKQNTVSWSSTEAEYRAMATTTCEIVWVVGLLRDMGVHLRGPTTLFCDNMAAIHIAANPMYHERMKHIEIDYHLVREKIKEGLIPTQYFPTHQQLGDIFMKSLGKAQHEYLLGLLGVRDLHQPWKESYTGSSLLFIC